MKILYINYYKKLIQICFYFTEQLRFKFLCIYFMFIPPHMGALFNHTLNNICRLKDALCYYSYYTLDCYA